VCNEGAGGRAWGCGVCVCVCVCRYVEPRVGQRVRLCSLLVRHMRHKGVIDKSLA
jgi:hypothetical protein